MSWKNVNMVDVKTDLDIIPVARYTFELLPGAKYSENVPGRIEVSAAIVNGGEFTGRKVFFSYPDPVAKEWSPKVLKRLMNSIGIDPAYEEDPVAYLNRVAHSHFSMPMKHSQQVNEETGTSITRSNGDIFNVSPAA